MQHINLIELFSGLAPVYTGMEGMRTTLVTWHITKAWYSATME